MQTQVLLPNNHIFGCSRQGYTICCGYVFSVSEIDKSNYTLAGTEYANNTNSWGGTGLIPMSTVGKINKTSSNFTILI